MAAPLRHVLDQGPVISSLLGVGWQAAFGQRPKALPELPTTELSDVVPPRSEALVAAYRRWAGGEARRDRGHLPPHLFPQWGFPILSRTLADVPYPLPRVLNQGCRVTVHQPLPSGEPLELAARLVDVREEPGKARLHQRLVTGTASAPEALVCDLFAVVPLPRDPDAPRPKRAPKPGVPLDARRLAERRFGATAGRDFAVLTGDFNPIHWIPMAARAAGFQRCILHGFATMAWAWEQLVTHRLMADPSRLRCLDVRFVRPVVLPATPRLFTWTDDEPADEAPAEAPPVEGATRLPLAVAEAPGGPPWMAGTAWIREP